jgi:hypothetical protein
MSHWETAGRLGAEHRADLDREAARASLVASVRTSRSPMRLQRVAAVFAMATIIAGLAAGTVHAGPPRLEPAWYEGNLVTFMQPAVFSADSNGGTFACFGLGPDLSRSSRSANAPTLYIILNDSATQDHCDGDPDALRHDHVLSAAPGDRGYTGSWTLVLAVPGPNFDPSAMPYTSVDKVEAGVAAGELVLINTGATMIAPVTGGLR